MVPGSESNLCTVLPYPPLTPSVPPLFSPLYSPSFSPLSLPYRPLQALHSSDGAIYDVVIEAFFKQGKNAKVTADRIMEAYEELSSGMPLAGGR